MEKLLPNTIADCRKKDCRAQRVLYDYCFSPMMAISLRYMKNREDALAVVNEAFLKVLLNIDTYDNQKPFLTWVMAITVRTNIDAYRKNKSVGAFYGFENQNFQEQYMGLDALTEELDAQHILEIIQRLPETERMVFNLFAVEGYSHAEIAEQLEVSERSSKRYLATAKNRLKQWITNLEFVFL